MDDPDENAGDEPPPGNVKKKNLTGGQVKQIVSQLLLLVKEGDENHSLKYGALKKVANNFDVTLKAISKIWKRGRESFDDPDIAAFRASPRKHLSGRKLKWNRDEVRDAVREVPFQSKRNLRCLSAALGIPLTSLHRMKEDKMDAVIVPHTNAVKPHLHDHHKLARVFYSVSKLDLAVDKWTDFYDSVHVDEKWFFITEAQLHMYLAPNEEAPHRTVGHKSHILKVMFLCAVARPRYNAQGECTFDGKIGMWPFVESSIAQRASVNRPAGTLEWKPVSVDKDRYRTFMIEKVLPAIKNKWPAGHAVGVARTVVIQQDGASSHIAQDDPLFVAQATQNILWNISLLTQPAQSPDTNLLDLSFFRALQSTQWDHGFASNIEGLIAQVLRAYDEFDPRKIEFGFLTLQCCLDEIMCSNGSNQYKIPHMNKARLLREGTLPTRVTASQQAVLSAKAILGLD